MTLEKLYKQVKLLIENKNVRNDSEVLITLSDVAAGARDSVGVSLIHEGFDFEKGQIRIEPEKRIFNNIIRMDNPCGIIREEFGGVGFNACAKCHMKVAKDDRYCRHCGQRLN